MQHSHVALNMVCPENIRLQFEESRLKIVMIVNFLNVFIQLLSRHELIHTISVTRNSLFC